VISVVIDGPRDVLKGLTRYFAPWFRDDQTVLPAIRVYLRVGGLPPKWRQRWESARHELVPRLRSLNKKVIWYVDACQLPARSLYRFTESDSWLCVDLERGELTLWAVDEERLQWDCKELLQCHITRPLMLRQSTLLHAAGVVINDRAWLICGEKGAGKSTLQINVGLGGGSLLSADRTYVRAAAEGPVAHGYPARASLRRDTFAQFAQLGDPAKRSPDGPTKVLFDLSELAMALGAKVVPSAKAAGIVVVSADGETRGLTQRQASEALHEHCLVGRDPLVPDWLYPPGQDAREARRAEELLIRSTAVVKLRRGDVATLCAGRDAPGLAKWWEGLSRIAMRETGP
jgi:hypothetical protein